MGRPLTRTTNARVSGVTLLAYIAAGIASMVVFSRATAGDGIAAKLAAIAQHPAEVGLVVLLGIVQSFSALVLAVTFHALTQEEDPDLALLGLVCRVGEGLIGAASVPGTLALLWLATANGKDAPDGAAAHVLAAYLLRGEVAFTATFFAAGSALFSYLLLRGRMIPVPLAWLGVVASALLVVALPLQVARFLSGGWTALLWLPMLAFEVPLAVWLIVRGAEAPTLTR